MEKIGKGRGEGEGEGEERNAEIRKMRRDSRDSKENDGR